MKALSITSRTITLELENNLPFYAKQEFEIYINGNLYKKERRNVFTIFNLSPNTSYTIQVEKEKKIIKTKGESLCLNVKDFYAVGNGVEEDTVKIQAAIAACPKNGCVYIPKGVYFISALFLKSDMTIYMEKDAKLIAKYDRGAYPILPQEQQGYIFGTWEGSLVDCFASSITALNCSNLRIIGEGEIDLQAQLGDWYVNHREKRIANRGFGMYFKECNFIEVIGIYIHNTPSWNIHPFFSKHLKFLNLRIENPVNMPTTDGLDPDC